MTLVEMLIAVALLGAVVVGMMGTLFTVTAASSQQQSSSISEGEGRRIAEYVRAKLPYQPCATPSDYNGALVVGNIGAVDPGVSAAVTAVRYWDGTMFAGGNPTFVSTCGAVDYLLQQITLTVTGPGAARSTVVFVKRSIP